jgi:glycosyltransferase involved in cell wall biosynthesis
LPQIRVPFELTLITAPGSGAEAVGHRFRAWSAEAVFDELSECDAVIIPSDPHNPRKIVKSPNRFTESLWAGRFVIAHPLPSYEQLAAHGWVGDDLGDGLAWLLENPEAAAARVRAGQRAVEEHFSPQAIGRAWQAAIAAL